jgi:Uracil DNA glycosylase superfamily
MATEFCPGYANEPYATLVRNAPTEEVYPQVAFRIEWGPIFHRGRLDGSARVLILGQDPAAHEDVVRRILIGTAGRRVQGFLAHLGITHSYVMINTFLYSVFGAGGTQHQHDVAIATYRNKWIAALLDSGGIEIVIAFGGLADGAWQAWKASPAAAGRPALPYQHVPHPTSPDSAGGTPAEQKTAIKAMLQKYNAAIAQLLPALQHPDTNTLVAAYGDDFADRDLPPIPQGDLPAGLPGWMGATNDWAVRGKGALARRVVTVTAPSTALP